MTNKYHIITSLIKEQQKTKELVMTAVLVAIGVNLCSTGIVALLGVEHSAIILICMGTAVWVGVLAKITYTRSKALDQTVKLKGFIVYNRKSKKLIDIPEYEIATDMTRYLQSAFYENKALETLWKQDTIDKFKVVGSDTEKRAVAISTHSGAILIELLEYCIIEKLSLHLSACFNDDSREKVQIIKREDIPDILLKNRFLKLFSEDMLNRSAFTNDKMFKDDMESTSGKVVCAMYSSGAFYNHFDLVLPKSSKVSRKSKNELKIDTPIFTLTIACLFGGFSTNLKPGFSKYYLGIIKDRNDYHNYEFNVEITIKFKIHALFSRDKETYFLWMDSLIDEISDYMSKDKFFNKIGWDKVYTMICCNNISERLATKTTSPSKKLNENDKSEEK